MQLAAMDLVTLAQNKPNLSVQEFINETEMKIDPIYVDKFWNNIADDVPILIDDSIIRYLGYSTKNINTARKDFKDTLKTYQLNHICKKYDEIQVRGLPCTFQNENMTEKALKQCNFILMCPDDFRQLCMSVKTEKGKEIRQYYLMLEKIFKEYLRYQKECAHNKIIETAHENQALKENSQKMAIKIMKLDEFINRTKPREKIEKFYIATTHLYAQNNRFKFGGVDSAQKLTGRLAVYNTGRPANDKYYYAMIIDVFNYKTIENRFKDVLPVQLKDDENNRCELVHCHFDYVEIIVNFIIDHHNEEIAFINESIKQIIEKSVEKAPRIPPPIIINSLKIQMTQNGQSIDSKLINLDEIDQQKQHEIVTKIFQDFISQLTIHSPTEIKRKEFETFMKQNHAYDFKSRALWKLLKDVSKNTIFKLKYY